MGTQEAHGSVIERHPLIEEILDAHRDRARGDEAGYAGYRGHVYRVFNYARHLVPDAGDDRDDKLAIAAAFHDLEAFKSLDYLAPSIRTQDLWLEQTGRAQWAPELAVIIAQHHRFTPYRGSHARLTEVFRVADLADVSQGLIHPGIPSDFMKAVRRTHDVGPFFTRLVPQAMLRHVVRHPLDPMPHVRARRGLTQAGHAGADRRL